MCYQQKIVRRTHRTVLNGLHTYLPAYARMHVHTYIHDHTCMHTCTHAHTQSHASMHPCIHASMHPCIHAHIHHCPPLLPTALRCGSRVFVLVTSKSKPATMAVFSHSCGSVWFGASKCCQSHRASSSMPPLRGKAFVTCTISKANELHKCLCRMKDSF